MMRCFRGWAAFLTLFLCISAAGESVYVSSSMGDDTNSGLSAESPLRTIEAAMKKPGDVFLKAGDIFYGSVVCRGRNLSRYGEGANPVVSGYKRLSGSKWQRVSRRVWRLDLRGTGFSGAGVSAASSLLNNIGCLHEYDKDAIHGRRVQFREDLKQDWDFWQVDTTYIGMDPACFDYLYLYSRRNPNRMKLELSIGTRALIVGDAIIDGVDFVGFGFGIAGHSRTVVRNCRIDAIGGMLQIGYPVFVCYGNGIEFYLNEDIEDCLVEHCWVSRCYDAGMTIQGSEHPGATPRNIVFRGNVVSHCCQAWEDFLRNGDDVLFVNCRFEQNLVFGSGDSGFGYADGRFKYCNVLGNNVEGDRGMIIRDNVFVGGNYYCSSPFRKKFRSNVWEGNRCYLTPGSFLLSNYRGTDYVIRVQQDGNEFVIARYRELTGDLSTEFVIVSPEEMAALERRLLDSLY